MKECSQTAACSRKDGLISCIVVFLPSVLYVLQRGSGASDKLRFKNVCGAYRSLSRKFIHPCGLCFFFLTFFSSHLPVFQSFENLSVESGGSGPEKDDPPGKTGLHNTQPLYCTVLLCESVEGKLIRLICFFGEEKKR